ncbi:replication factor A protein 3 [Fistulina hepatica ATCC 64428]|nr:replication factor A protein 3 [Fistulina hepatica ATCC 64428]
MSSYAPRVNSKRMQSFRAKPVRLICKIENISGSSATVTTSDGGEVAVKLTPDFGMEQGPYLEIIGNVVDDTTLKMMTFMNMGQDLDMKLVDDAIELSFSPTYRSMFHPDI